MKLISIELCVRLCALCVFSFIYTSIYLVRRLFLLGDELESIFSCFDVWMLIGMKKTKINNCNESMELDVEQSSFNIAITDKTLRTVGWLDWKQDLPCLSCRIRLSMQSVFCRSIPFLGADLSQSSPMVDCFFSHDGGISSIQCIFSLPWPSALVWWCQWTQQSEVKRFQVTRLCTSSHWQWCADYLEFE